MQKISSFSLDLEIVFCLRWKWTNGIFNTILLRVQIQEAHHVPIHTYACQPGGL